jgi:hypothetical protein
MCKVRCGLKDAFIFILTSMKIRKTTQWRKKVKNEKIQFFVRFLCVMVLMQHAFLKACFNFTQSSCA